MELGGVPQKLMNIFTGDLYSMEFCKELGLFHV